MSQKYQQHVDLTIKHNVKYQQNKHNFDFDHSSSTASSKSNPDRKNYLNKVIPVHNTASDTKFRNSKLEI